MSRIDLQTAFLDGGVHHVHFFNGRILSGEDLQDEQTANRRQQRQLGQAIGSGVVHGLEVAVTVAGGGGVTPVVEVGPGLALDRAGHTLELPQRVEINLLGQDSSQSDQGGLFSVCIPPQPQLGYIGTGAYVLLLAPASDFRQRAPLHGLDDQGKARGCGARYTVEGVRFRLLKLPVGDLLEGLGGLTDDDFTEPTAADSPGWWRLRNALAQLCLGTAERAQYQVDFSSAGELAYGALDRLPSDSLSHCEVPLALVYWTGEGIRFVDNWAVRRHPVERVADPAWSTVFNPRFPVVAQATVLQFQDQIAALAEDTTITTDVARVEDHFTHLPPVGYLPVGGGGFNWETFLGAHAPAGVVTLSEALARTVVDAALLRAPLPVVDRDADQAQQATRLKVYRIDGRDDYLLFARPGPAEVLAQEVHFDNGSCQLTDVQTVQEALNELCQRLKGCCTLVIAPQPDWQQALSGLTPGQDLSICFQAGQFSLAQPLVLSNLGHVRLYGAGPGTQLTAAGSEAVLRFENCTSVSVSHLRAESGVAQSPGNEAVRHLNGTLTFTDCPRVTVEEVLLQCAGGSQRAASCLNVRNTTTVEQGQLTSVRIQGCELVVGRRQTGILVTNSTRCQIRDNVVRSTGTETTLGQGIVVGGDLARDVRILDNSVFAAVQGIHVGVSHREANRGTPDQVEWIRISGNTVHIRLGSQDTRERHALFIGNSASLAVENNYATLTRDIDAEQNIEGLRLYGHFGRRIIVRGNHFERFSTGILLNPRNDPPQSPTLQWVIDDNLAVSAAQVVNVVPSSLRSRVRGVSNNYA